MFTEIGNNSPLEKEKMNDATNRFIEDYSNNAHECEDHLLSRRLMSASDCITSGISSSLDVAISFGSSSLAIINPDDLFYFLLTIIRMSRCILLCFHPRLFQTKIHLAPGNIHLPKSYSIAFRQPAVPNSFRR